MPKRQYAARSVASDRQYVLHIPCPRPACARPGPSTGNRTACVSDLILPPDEIGHAFLALLDVARNRPARAARRCPGVFDVWRTGGHDPTVHIVKSRPLTIHAALTARRNEPTAMLEVANVLLGVVQPLARHGQGNQHITEFLISVFMSVMSFLRLLTVSRSVTRTRKAANDRTNLDDVADGDGVVDHGFLGRPHTACHGAVIGDDLPCRARRQNVFPRKPDERNRVTQHKLSRNHPSGTPSASSLRRASARPCSPFEIASLICLSTLDLYELRP